LIKDILKISHGRINSKVLNILCCVSNYAQDVSICTILKKNGNPKNNQAFLLELKYFEGGSPINLMFLFRAIHAIRAII